MAKEIERTNANSSSTSTPTVSSSVYTAEELARGLQVFLSAGYRAADSGSHDTVESDSEDMHEDTSPDHSNSRPGSSMSGILEHGTPRERQSSVEEDISEFSASQGQSAGAPLGGGEDIDEDDQPDPGCLQQQQVEERGNSASETPMEYRIDDIAVARRFINELKNASHAGLDDRVREQVTNPPRYVATLDDNERLSLDIFLAISNASEETYNSVRIAISRRYPDSDMLSFYQVKSLLENLTGVVPVTHDMCVNSCVGYCGAYRDLVNCPSCGERRYTKEGGSVPRKQFHTIPIGPQLQALWRSKEGVESMQYRTTYTRKVLAELSGSHGRTSPYRDFFDGSDYLEAIVEGKIKDGDMVLMMSMDGAQLYRMKASDCWIYIWIIMDLSPDTRYTKKHVLPGGFIPGPNKPKNIDSFLFPGLYHLAALQRDGLTIWNAKEDTTFKSSPFLALVTADAPAMALLNGTVGHHGKYACRLYCPLPGRHKPGAPHYYPARFLPNGYTVRGCDHQDISLRALLRNFNSGSAKVRYEVNLRRVESSPNKTVYEANRLETGICRPSIFMGLSETHRLAIPSLFPGDNMHLPALNLTDLFLSLWRGTIDCDPADSKDSWDWFVLRGDIWKEHGKQVAAATPWIPGSFDRPPRNIAEKISSGYKAWEFLLYFYCIGPALLYGILPDAYYRHYCCGVRPMRLVLQEEITPAELILADSLFTKFSDDFESLYIQRKASRIHFARQSIHTPSHLPHEVLRLGPGGIYSQWTMERTIGNLGEEIKQHSDAFSNIQQRGIRRCQVNAVKAMIWTLDPEVLETPRGARILGDGYMLLPALDTAFRGVTIYEAAAIRIYLRAQGQIVADSYQPTVKRWARLQLPNGQQVRTAWKEGVKPIEEVRCSRHVMISGPQGKDLAAEILFFTLLPVDNHLKAVALVLPFSAPDPGILDISYNCYWTSEKQDDSHICVIDVKQIKSSIIMAPDVNHSKRTQREYWYMSERPGLKLTALLQLASRTENESD